MADKFCKRSTIQERLHLALVLCLMQAAVKAASRTMEDSSSMSSSDSDDEDEGRTKLKGGLLSTDSVCVAQLIMSRMNGL